MSTTFIATTKTPQVKRENSVSQKRKGNFSQSISSPVDEIFLLQRSIGNHAAQELIKTGNIRAKLKIGQPNDLYEQEADKIADQMMRMSDPMIQPKPPSITPLIQRQEPEEEEEKRLQTVRGKTPPEDLEKDEENKEDLQAKGQSSHVPRITPQIESTVGSLKGGGQPLDPVTRAHFESRFGQDFSRVRVHTDTPTAASAKAIAARAYTMGNDIVFDSGQYSPSSEAGMKLLAHELAHVCQQNRKVYSGEKPRSTQKISPVAVQRQQREERPTTIDEWEIQAEGIAQENMKQTIAAWSDFIVDSQIYLLEKGDLEMACEMLLIPFGVGGALRRTALAIIAWLKAETAKMHIDLQKEEVKEQIKSVVDRAIDEWSVGRITKKAQELRKSANPTVPPLPPRVPSDLKYSLYLAWMRASTDFGLGYAQQGSRQVPAYTSKPVGGVGRAHWRGMLEKTRRLEQDLGLSPEESWNIVRDPVLIRNVIKRFFLEEAGIAIADASGMEKEGSALCERGEGNERGIGEIGKERSATVTDASKANTAAHGFLGRLFTEKENMIENSDQAMVTLTWNSVQCWTPKSYTEVITHPEEHYYESGTGKEIVIPEQKEQIEGYRPEMEPHPKRPLLRAQIKIPRLGLEFDIQK